MGPTPLEFISRWMNKATGHFVPVWNPYMPKGAAPLPPTTSAPAATLEVCVCCCCAQLALPLARDCKGLCVWAHGHACVR
jgi:D-lactate dehydrogenase